MDEHRDTDRDPRVPRTLADRLRDQGAHPWAVRWGVIAWALIGVLILSSVVVWALMQVQDVFPPLVLALVTIYILNPLVSRMEGKGVPRLAGSCLSYAVFFALLAVALIFLVPMVVDQGQAFVRDFPRTVEGVEAFAERVSEDVERRFDVRLDAADWVSADLAREGLAAVGRFLRGAVHTVALLVLGLIIGFYLLVDLPRLKRSLLALIPPDRRGESVELASTVGRAMGGFFRGQLLVALIVGVMSAIALRIVGIPYWLVIGMIAGFFNLIPLIGPFVGAIPGILVAAAYGPPIDMLWVAVALTIVQQIDNHLISPNVMRWTVRLHPVTVMLALIVGATLLGFWGMLLAVPVVASAKVVAGYYWRTRVPWGHEVFGSPDTTESAEEAPATPADHEEPPVEAASAPDA